MLGVPTVRWSQYDEAQVHARSVPSVNTRNPRISLALCTGLVLLFGPPARASDWTGALRDGSELRVDPRTHRAMQVEGERVRPLWDGVHHLEDGSVVIIRGGTAVPTQEMLRTWEGGVPAVEELAGRPCEQLERRVCGYDNSCRTSAACLSARSLLNSEREAQRRAPLGAGARPATEYGSRCQAALGDPEFPPCARVSAGPSTCQALVMQVCGEDGRCASSPACAPARQLRDQETEERAASPSPDALTPSGVQCQEALGNPFFKACE